MPKGLEANLCAVAEWLRTTAIGNLNILFFFFHDIEERRRYTKKVHPLKAFDEILKEQIDRFRMIYKVFR